MGKIGVYGVAQKFAYGEPSEQNFCRHCDTVNTVGNIYKLCITIYMYVYDKMGKLL